MRTSVDIPDAIYRAMKVYAAVEGTTIREIIVDSVTARLRIGKAPAGENEKRKFPLIRSRSPGSLKLGEEGVYEYIPFP
jgi:hypothetical protein